MSSGTMRNPISKIKVDGASEMTHWAKEFVQAWELEFDTQHQHKCRRNLTSTKYPLTLVFMLVLNLPNN